MSIICGIHKDGVSYLAADRRTTINNYRFPEGTQKIVEFGPVAARAALAVAGDMRALSVVLDNTDKLAQALFGDHLDPRNYEPRVAHKYADARALAKELRRLLTEDGFQKKDTPGALYYPCEFLLATRVAVYNIGTTFHVHRMSAGVFASGGSGDEVSRGAAAFVNFTAPELTLPQIVSVCGDVLTSCGDGCDVWASDRGFIKKED